MIKNRSIIITIAILFILAGTVYIILGNPFSKESPSPEAVPTEPPSTPITTPAKPPVPSLEEKIAGFRQSVVDVAATGESKELTLVFTEAEVNDHAAKILTQVEMPEDIPLEVKSVHIDLQPNNNLLTEAETTILGLGVTLKAGTQVSIKEGKPDVAITEVSFGFIPIPGPIKDRITAFITQKTDDLLVQLTETATGDNGKVDLEFKEVNIQEEKVTITVLIKPIAE